MPSGNPKEEDPVIAHAVVRALDRMADSLPDLLEVSDEKMVSLQETIERGLRRALKGKREC